MAHGRSTKSILMIKWIRTIRLSIKNSLSRVWSWFGVEGLGYRVYHANGLDGVVHLKEIFKISTFEEIQDKLNFSKVNRRSREHSTIYPLEGSGVAGFGMQGL